MRPSFRKAIAPVFTIASGLGLGLAFAADDDPKKSEPAADKPAKTEQEAAPKTEKTEKIVKTEEEWKAQLTPMQFYVTRKKGTEFRRSGDTWDLYEPGTYACVCCGLPLFSSETKFKSGTGWPSFYDAIKKGNIATEKDTKYGWDRVEMLCSRCDAHIGHVFDDGPEPTGLRYCANSAALKFLPKQGDKGKAKTASDGDKADKQPADK